SDLLMQYETIDAEQIDDIMNGVKPARPPKGWVDKSGGGGSGGSAPATAATDQPGPTIGGPASQP
ncbi:MAG: hypothetical protein ACLGHJ_02205, partial [Gammaproteobacteria bacterium]